MLLCLLNGLLGLPWLLSPSVQDEPLGWPIAPLGDEHVSSYAAIDQALESRLLILPGDTWRYFPGTEEPSPELEWVRADFDDSGWQRGPSPFTYGGDQASAGGTQVPAFGEGVSTLYLRCKFNLPDPTLYERVWLEMLVDDGYILYLNRVEERRLGAGDAEERQPFDATATSERRLEERPMPRFDLTRPIKTGLNQIAIQALVSDRDRGSFGFYPSVRGIYRSTPEGERAHYEELKQLLEASASSERERLLAYLEGRHLQRLGEHAKARDAYQALVQLDPDSRLAYGRLVECHRALGSLEALEAWLRGQALAGSAAGALADCWAAVWLEELGRPLAELAALVPEGVGFQDAPTLSDALWSAWSLAQHGTLLLNAGCSEDLELDGRRWSRDRFDPEQLSQASAADPLASSRSSRRDLDGLRDMYRIPVINGTYGVALWGGEAMRGQLVDVHLEGARRAGRELGTQLGTGLELVTQVRDGFLNLDLAPVAGGPVSLAALELRLLSAEATLALARERAPQAASTREGELEWVLLGEAEWAAGNLPEALAAFERAEGQPSFSPAARARLQQLRDELLPRILSIQSAEDLAARHGARWERVLEAAEQAEGSDPGALVYFAGASHQRKGEFDEALGAFEQLVFDQCAHPAPYIAMSLSLSAVGLPEDAAGILDLALENGLPAEGELLQAWISANLGELDRDPWELVDQLADMDVPPQLVLVPTSEEYGLPWRFTYLEPNATTWSRPSFSVDHWDHGIGPIGSGAPLGGYPRTLWNRIMFFARTSFELQSPHLLYPFLRVYGRGSNDVYLNGTRVSRHLVATQGYKEMPLRAPSVTGAATDAKSTGLQKGTNLLGMFGYNTRGPSMLDVGIQQDFETLFWIRDQLNERRALRFNCGGEALTTADGRLFHGDRFYSWGIRGSLSEAQEGADIAGTEDDELYHTTRRFYDDSVSAWYEVPLPNGSYRVVLHFAEIDPKLSEPGARMFDVTLEEQRVLSAFDVSAEGGYMQALVREFDVQVVDGWLDLKLTDKEHFSFLSALEILAQ